jgi:methyltransferase
MTFASIILGLVTLQRLGELVLARTNTERLLRRGAVEVGANHYLWLVAMHGLWLVSLWVFGWSQPVSLPWLGLFLVLQALRGWVLVTLGQRWTTRIIVLPKEPLVHRGPYRFLSHPNYVVVAGEIAALPLAFGLPAIAVIFTVLNGLMLTVRIRSENAALSELSHVESPAITARHSVTPPSSPDFRSTT